MKSIGRVVVALTLVISSVLAFTPLARASENLVPNPSVEVVSANPDLPESWGTGYLWGDLDANYEYLSTGYASNRSVKVTITRYVSGDAKWYFAPVAVAANQVYRYSDTYSSTLSSSVFAAITRADGSTNYLGLPDAPAAASWANYSASITTPADATALTVFHVIAGVGSLTTDNFSLTATTIDPTFNRGLVSITFDDGWQSQYVTARPILDQFGFKATYYIVTGFVNTPEYMTLSQIKALSQAGNELGSHSVHHYDLTTLTLKQLTSELSQSLNYLRNKTGSRAITSFAYPYGAYNARTDQQVRKYYKSARSSDVGINRKATFNPYNIQSEYITPQTTLAEVQGWVTEAKNQHEWLVLMYHQVDASGSEYSVAPTALAAQLQEVRDAGLPVKTVTQALAELQPQL